MRNAQEEWARCKHWIAASLKRSGGFYGIEDVERMIEDGRLVFWPMRSSAVLTEFIEYPQGRALNAFVSGGSLRELRDEFEPFIAQFAKEQGCRWVLGFGRKGWVRASAASGYRLINCLLVKELI